MTESGSAAERLAGEIEKVKEQASRNLLSVVVDIQDTLTTNMTDSPEKSACEVVNKSLSSFFDAKPKFDSAIPRRIREQDRTKLLPGQHAGVTITFSLPDNTTLRINIYGGLRAFANADMRDSDLSLRKSHTQRTDAVLSQPTFINWHIKNADGEVISDVWIKKTQPNINVEKIILNQEKIDIVASINQGTYGFKDMSDAFSKNINDLTTLVASNY